MRRDGATVFEECLDQGLIDPATFGLTPAGETIASIVGATSLILAVDAERMGAPCQKCSAGPRMEIKIADDGLLEDLRDHVTEQVRANLQSRSIGIEPDGWPKIVQVR